MKNRSHGFGVTSGFLLFCLGLSTAALAKDNPDYTQWGHDINIGPNDKTGELTCIWCNIRVRGEVAGDVTTVGGNVVIEDQGEVAGEVTSVGGNVRLDKAVHVAGDVTVVGGTLRRDPQASVGGEVTALAGWGWLLLIIATPIVILGVLLAMVIWLIQRVRSPAVPAPVAR